MSTSADSAVKPAEFGWPGGDAPGEPVFAFEPLPGVAARLRQFLEERFPDEVRAPAEIRALQEMVTPAGRFRARASGHEWFLKLTARPGSDSLEQALTQHLAARGVPVAPLLSTGALEIAGEVFRVQVQPLIHGRHFNGSEGDLRAATETLRLCHQALRDFPAAGEIRTAAAARYESLRQARDRMAGAVLAEDYAYFAEAGTWARENAPWLRAICERFDPRFDRLPGAQALHSQPHPGNVLFEPSGRAVLIDFEESVRAYAPPAWDLAYLVQRFCLRDQPPGEVLRRRIAVIREAYGPEFPPVVSMMRQTSWFSMAILTSQRALHRVSAPLAEYEKFVRLEREASAWEKEIDG